MNMRLPCFLSVLAASALQLAIAQDVDERPNILLIIADDLGYADLGAYGGDIDTPNIDSIAREGVLFTQFHTAAMCAPTRAMLYSGNNNHVAGVAHQGVEGVADVAFPGYENSLSDRIVPFPRLLSNAGYNTYIVGKWHLGTSAETSPAAAGFSRSFTLLEGAGTHWDTKGYKEGGSNYWRDDDFTEYPTGRYSTEVYTDSLIEFIEQGRSDDKPFLAVAAYTSPHWPLQAPDEYLDRYAGRYDDGYDALRERRFASLKKAGIIPPESRLPPRNEAITPWKDLNSDQRRRESRKMELYAAMVDNLDDHVGRLLAYLDQQGLRESTLVVFMSDNGAAAEDFYNIGPYVDYVRSKFDNSDDNMGRPISFVSYGPQWAEAGSAPFSRYKGFTRQGGLVAPMLISGYGVARETVISSAYVTVMDLAPTFLELAAASYPDDDGISALTGESMTGLLAGRSTGVHAEDYITTMFHNGRAYLRQGDWKISNQSLPFDESGFELHNVADDPGETIDLALMESEQFDALLRLWREERRRLGIVLPEDL